MKSFTLIFLFYLVVAIPSKSFGVVPGDSTFVEKNESALHLKEFDQVVLDEFHANEEFDFDLPPDTRPNFLQVLFQKFFHWLVLMLGNEVFAWLVLGILIIIGLLGLGFAFYGIFGVGKTIPIYNKEKDSLDYVVLKDDIHEINFLDEIDIASEHKNYKKAIRLVYLYTLKLLSDQQIIDWQPSKTNHDYLYEIKNESYQNHFSELSYYFENVWYGDFPPNINHYNKMNQSFSGFKDKLLSDV